MSVSALVRVPSRSILITHSAPTEPGTPWSVSIRMVLRTPRAPLAISAVAFEFVACEVQRDGSMGSIPLHARCKRYGRPFISVTPVLVRLLHGFTFHS